MQILLKNTVILFSCLALGPMATASEWPRFRGPNHDGISSERDWFSANAEARTVWEADVGAGHSAVAIAEGRLYTMGNRQARDVVLCLDALTGKPVWEHAYDCQPGNYPGPRSTPTVDRGLVFTLSREGRLLCLTSDKGKLKWERNLGRDMALKVPSWGLAGSPLVAGDRVIVNIGTNGLAVDKRTGVTRWHSGSTGAGYASPVPCKWGGHEAVLVFATEAVVAVDPASGRRLWAYPWKTGCDVNAADPLPMDGKVLITSGYGHGQALLDVSGDTPRPMWENRNLTSHFSTPIRSGAFIYGVHGDAGDGELRCIDLATGAVKWQKPELGFGSLAMADGKLIFLNEQGLLAILKDSPDSCQELWSRQVLDKTCWTAPVLCNGLLYCRNDKGRLVCLNLSGK